MMDYRRYNMNYLVALVSPSHHLMFEKENYIKVYSLEAGSQNEFENKVERLERQFSLEFKVPLVEVYHLWTFKVKDKYSYKIKNIT